MNNSLLNACHIAQELCEYHQCTNIQKGLISDRVELDILLTMEDSISVGFESFLRIHDSETYYYFSMALGDATSCIEKIFCKGRPKNIHLWESVQELVSTKYGERGHCP